MIKNKKDYYEYLIADKKALGCDVLKPKWGGRNIRFICMKNYLENVNIMKIVKKV